ncbi:MAG: hypothetical protein B6U97_04995 [Candidatus Altiarchaeales archaeon ex4484_96]|nr:MAG: hypothetical protein B6U97_04995 [Candidatus Altiarchaeales archaeon ex4484_96]
MIKKSAIWIMAMMVMSTAAVADNVAPGFTSHSDIPVTDGGWSTTTVTNDCSPDYDGWCDDRWFLTLSEAKDVTIGVNDCCMEGDYYEVYIDDVLVYTTPVPDDWAVWPGDPSELSSGQVTVSLLPGVYEIEVKDAAFQDHLDDMQDMCPAGFTVWGNTSTYTGPVPAPEFGSLAIALAALLSAPAFAYLLVKKRE